MPATEWENIFAKHLSDKGLESRVYRVLNDSVTKNLTTNQEKKKKAKEFNISPKKIYEQLVNTRYFA